MDTETSDSFVWVTQYIDWFEKVRRKRPSSVDQYGRVLRTYCLFVTDPLVATPQDVESFMYRSRKGQTGEGEASAATINRDRAIVSSFYKYLQVRGVRSDNPVELTGAPEVYNRNPRAVPDHVWQELWRSEHITFQDRVMIGLMGICGLRRMELVQVTANHFDLSRGHLLLPNRKGGKETMIEYHDMAYVVGDNLPHLIKDPSAEFLAPLGWLVKLRGRDQFLMTWMSEGVGENIVNRELEKVLLAAGMPGDSFTPHALRHTAATNLARAGVPIEVIADQMGHADLRTTRNYLRTSGQLRRWRKHND